MRTPPKNATISDHAAGDPDPMPSRSSRAKKRGQQEEADRREAKVARLASAEEETTEQESDATLDAPLTTENIMKLLDDLWSGDKWVIVRALDEIADFGDEDVAPDYENELKMRVLGVHITVFQVLKKHAGCLEIQEEGMRALGNLSMLLPTKTLLGDIGCVEVILARMEKYPDSVRVQLCGCYVIGKLVNGAKGNAGRVEKSGGIAVVIAAMKAHPHCEELQDDGCIALSKMSEWEEYRPLIVEAGGASAIAFVMEKCRDHPLASKRAYNAMERLIKKPT
jgi:hypothetical protein